MTRMTQGTSGSVVTNLRYDSLSRLLSDTTAGRMVGYRYDDVDNPVRMFYPSGLEVGQEFDELDRPSLIGNVVSNEIVRRAEYKYRGPSLLHQKTFGGSLTQTVQYDAARRPEHMATLSAAGKVVEETLASTAIPMASTTALPKLPSLTLCLNDHSPIPSDARSHAD